MKVLDKLAQKVGKWQRLREQLAPEFATAQGTSIDPDDSDFRRLTQTKRDLNPLEHERSINISYWLYERNGFFTRLINIALQAIKNAGFVIKTDDEVLRELWFEFWQKPHVGFKRTFFNDYKDVKLSGEADWPIGWNPISGELEIGYIDPLNVKRIKTLPGNVKIADKLVMKLNVAGDGKTFSIIRSIAGQLIGELYHFPINKPVNATRGRPQLLALLDQIDLYDQALFSEGERMIILKSFVWDVEIEGSDEEKQKDWFKKHFPGGAPLKPGSAHIHDEKVKMEALSPSLNASDSKEMLNLFRQNTAGMAGYPDFFMGWGGDVNVATAREMMKPTIWMIEDDQENMANVLTDLFAFQLAKFDELGKQTSKGVFRMKPDDEWEIVANNVFPRDFVLQSTAFRDVISTIAVAKSQGFLSEKHGMEMFVMAANELGFELVLSELQEELEKEAVEKDEFGNEEVIPENGNGDLNKKLGGKSFRGGPGFGELLRMSREG